MCGIVALLSKKGSIKFLLNGLKQLQNRGYDSAGICIMHNEFNNLKFASTNEKSAIKN